MELFGNESVSRKRESCSTFDETVSQYKLKISFMKTTMLHLEIVSETCLAKQFHKTFHRVTGALRL